MYLIKNRARSSAYTVFTFLLWFVISFLLCCSLSPRYMRVYYFVSFIYSFILQQILYIYYFRKRTRVPNTAQIIAKLKWQWTRQISRRTDGRRVLGWRPSIGRPTTRWTDGDDPMRVAEIRWRRVAPDRSFWRSLR